VRTIGVFGGSFDPPHAAHQHAASYALQTHALDELWLVPVLVHPHRKQLAAYEDRVAMCELAVHALGPRVRVSRAEQEVARIPCHTHELLDHLAARDPGARFRLVIGSDLLAAAAAWQRWDEVVARAPLIVVERSAISATDIRARLARDDRDGVAALVPRSVLRYITERGLYRGERQRTA
jgi:nicotinate-nucleotide adenylyltransferase